MTVAPDRLRSRLAAWRSPDSPEGWRHRTLSAVFWLLLFGLVAWWLRAPYLGREIWNLDEASTFTMAQQLRAGEILYLNAADNRSPLVPYLQAAVFAVAGDWNLRAQHLALVLGYGLAAWMLFDLVRRLGRFSAGIWTALAFSVLAFTLPGILDALGAHTEVYLIFFSVWGAWLLVRALPSGDFPSGLGLGLAFADASLCKQPGVLDFAVMLAVLGLLAWRQPADRARLIRLAAGAGVAFIAAWTAVCAFFWAHHAWDDFVYYTWQFNTQLYVPAVPLPERLAMVQLPVQHARSWLPVVLVLFPLGVVRAGVGAAASLRAAATPAPVLTWLTLGWLASGFGSTMLSGRDFSHYVIQSIPGLALACGLALDWLATGNPWPVHRRSFRVIGSILLAGALGWAAFSVAQFRHRLFPHDDSGQADLRQVVQRYTAPTDPIFVWGYFPEGYAATRRLPATRFIYTNFLTGLIPWTNLAPEIDTRYAIVPGGWDAFWHDYAARPPQLILASSGRGYVKYPLLSQPRLRDEVIDHFAQIDASSIRDTSVYRRLVPAPTQPLPPNAAVNADLQFSATRVPGQPDLVMVLVSAPIGVRQLVLQLGAHSRRALSCLPTVPTEVRFLLRTSELATFGVTATAFAETEEGWRASATLDLARRLLLSLPQPQPQPVIRYGTDFITPTRQRTEDWQEENHPGARGWRSQGRFEIVYPRPPRMETLEYLVAADTGMPQCLFAAEGRGLEELPVKAIPAGAYVRGVIDLPRADPGQIILRHPEQTPLWLGELSGYAHGPQIQFGDRAIPPSAAMQDDQFRLSPASDGTWDATAFARLLYPRLPGMEAISLTYGVRETALTGDATALPPWLNLEVNYLHEDGRSENLLTRGLEPAKNPDQRGLQHARFSLPSLGLGQIEIRFVPMQRACRRNFSYIGSIRAHGAGPDLVISPQRLLVPSESESGNDDRVHLRDENGWMAHAPSRVVYEIPADLRAVSFAFGLPDAAVADEHGNRRSDGIDLLVEFADSSGVSRTLLHRHLVPSDRVADRGPQSVRVALPGHAGRLIIRLTPGPQNNPAYDWSYLSDLTGETASPAP